MHVNIDTDTWFLNSVFAHFDLAGELVGYMYNTAVSDELTKSINELQRRVAELLAKAYGLQPSAKSDDSRAADKSIQDRTSRRPDLEGVLDDLRDSGERADAFANAAKDLVEELAAKEKCDKHQWTKLSHLVSATFEAIQEVTDVTRVLGQRFSEQDSAS
jgi:hypothetical protein